MSCEFIILDSKRRLGGTTINTRHHATFTAILTKEGVMHMGIHRHRGQQWEPAAAVHLHIVEVVEGRSQYLGAGSAIRQEQIQDERRTN